MNTQIHKPEWQRIEIWLLWAAIFAAVLLFLAPRAADFERAATDTSAVAVRLPQGLTTRTARLPFTVWDVKEYFSTVLEMSSEKGADGAIVFENQQTTVPEDRWRIAITTEGKGVLVQFVTGGEYGMNLAREFFECPLFERAESEQLYGMLSHAQDGPVITVRRFVVGMTYKQTAKEMILLLRFSPPNAA